jgi:hypothetical protein
MISLSYSKQVRNLDSSGAIVRRLSNDWGGNDTTGNGYNDVVSEGQGFGLKLAVQHNDQTAFNLIYSWTAANLQRTNQAVMNQPGGSNFSTTIALHCFGWHYNWDSKVVVDADPAPDAECDIITALLWADARWGSTGSLNYKQLALSIAHDLMNYFFIVDSSTGYAYGPTATEYEKGKTDFQDDCSYGDPTCFRLLMNADNTNATFWNNAINGYYNQLTLDTTYHVSGQGNPVGLPSDQVQLADNTTPFSVFVENLSSFGYDAVKVPYRVRWDNVFASEPRAISFLAGSAKSFVNGQYSVTSGIPAQYAHDGSSNGGYVNTLFHFSYYQLLIANDPNNANGQSLFSNWLSPSKLYVVDSTKGGAYICDKPEYLTTGYFADYWNHVGAMMSAGLWTNY